MKTVLLYSGGMDSVIMNHLYKPDVRLFILTGLGSNFKELGNALSMQAETGQVVVDNSLDLKSFELPNKIVPGRNALFVLVASQYGQRILMGATRGDTTRDKDQAFADTMETLLGHMYRPAEKSPDGWQTDHRAAVLLPGRTFTKTELVGQFLATKGDPNLLRRSRSCYESNVKECGQCRACVRKYVALASNHVITNGTFQDDPRRHLRAGIEYARKVGRHEEVEEMEDLL